MKLRPNNGDSTQVLVIGGEAAKGLAAHLAEAWDVKLLSDDEEIVASAGSEQFDAGHVDFEGDDLERHASDADAAVVGTERDRVGLMVVQLLNTACDLDRVLVRVNDPKKKDAFRDVDCKIIETGSLLRPEVERALAPEDG